MNIEEQNNAELEKIYPLIEHISVAMLTTADDDGALVSRPMSPLEVDGDGAIWFFTDRRSEKVAHLNKVNISFADEARSTYVSLSGRAELNGDRTRMAALWTAYSRPWFPDGPQSLNLVLLKFIPEKAEYWDAPSSKMIRMFAMAASVVAGKPIGMGEHDLLTNLASQQENTGESHEPRSNYPDRTGADTDRRRSSLAV